MRQLRELGELGKSFDELCSSFAHMHVNRLGGLASLPEQRILSLLRRTREGLHKSPASKSDASAG
jgi:hypothetical protein